MNAQPPRSRYDGFMNVLSGLGTPGLDRTMSTMQSGINGRHGGHWRRYSAYAYAELYMTNGLAKKIVDRPSDDAFQRGVEIEGDDDQLMSDEYDRLQVLAKMADAVRWSRLCGGAALLLIVKDGGEFTDPLNLNALESVEEIKVLDATCIKGTSLYYDDVTDPLTYGKMEFYTITCPGVQSFDVHETRLIPMSGEPVPYGGMSHISRVHWIGSSALETCYDDIVRYGQGLEWSLRLLERKQQAVYKMDGLGEMFANGDDSIVASRINLVDMVRGNLNSVVVDKNDDYTIQTPGMDGVDTALQEYQTALAASSNFPVTILFGKSTRGLNQTGSSDLEAYYGMVSKIQQVIARPTLEKLTSVLWVQTSVKGQVPKKWKIKFNPLWVLNEVELSQAELNEKTANSTEVTMLVSLMDNQIFAPEEIRQIVVAKYPEYEFPDKIPDSLGNVDYAEGVDQSLMDPPTDPSLGPTTDPKMPSGGG